jgi:hypothetical protein
VDGSDIGPVSGEVLAHKPTVTTVCSGLAAEKGSSHLKVARREGRFDPPLGHQTHKALFVISPGAFALFEVVEKFLSRCEERLVLILSTGQLAQEVRKVLRLCEAGELRRVVEPDVKKPGDARVS